MATAKRYHGRKWGTMMCFVQSMTRLKTSKWSSLLGDLEGRDKEKIIAKEKRG